MKTLIIFMILVFAASCILLPSLRCVDAAPITYIGYQPSSTCETCHAPIVTQHSASQHSKAFSDPLFQAQYFKEVLPRAEKDAGLLQEARACIACHSPIDAIKFNGLITSRDQGTPAMSGIVCDFCHAIKGFEGAAPGNGNFIPAPSPGRKLGPFHEADNWHHVYSELQTKSEICGICHNATNHNGLEVKSTFTEWKNSRYATEGIQCQDCHMNLKGFLQGGKPVYESGRAADPSSTFGIGGRYHSTLYTHRFPGAHSRTQIAEAETITLIIETEKKVASPGDEIIIHVRVDNSKTGHKMPSGSKELRHLWLELAAYNGNKKVFIPATAGADTYDLTGKGPSDREILGDDIPGGSRIYRTVLVDAAGKQTLAFYDAVKIIFDNRLSASEIRDETFYFKIPQDFKDKILLQANLNYLPYPSSFSTRFGLPKPVLFEVSSAKKELLLK